MAELKLRFKTYADDEQLKNAISILANVLEGESNKAFLESIDIPKTPIITELGIKGAYKGTEPLVFRAPTSKPKKLTKTQLAARKAEEKKLLKAEKFAVSAAAELEAKSPEFTLPAFKALEEFRRCASSSNYSSFLCLSAF